MRADDTIRATKPVERLAPQPRRALALRFAPHARHDQLEIRRFNVATINAVGCCGCSSAAGFEADLPGSHLVEHRPRQFGVYFDGRAPGAPRSLKAAMGFSIASAPQRSSGRIRK